MNRKTLITFTAALLIVSLSARSAYGQFDMAAIMAALKTMNDKMTTFMATPLKEMNKIQTDEATFQKTVMFPAQQLSLLQQSANRLIGSVGAMYNLFTGRTINSTLPQTRAFETLTLSGSAANINNLRPAYTAVFGQLPPSNTTHPAVLNLIDAQDAEAQDAFSTSIKIDDLATQEATEAKNLMSQIASASPGGAELLSAQASALLLQGQAYSQQAYAEILRVRATQMASNSAALKINTATNSGASQSSSTSH